MTREDELKKIADWLKENKVNKGPTMCVVSTAVSKLTPIQIARIKKFYREKNAKAQEVADRIRQTKLNLGIY